MDRKSYLVSNNNKIGFIAAMLSMSSSVFLHKNSHSVLFNTKVKLEMESDLV